MKRLVIYFHYDSQGQIDAPCRYAVRALLPLPPAEQVTLTKSGESGARPASTPRASSKLGSPLGGKISKESVGRP